VLAQDNAFGKDGAKSFKDAITTAGPPAEVIAAPIVQEAYLGIAPKAPAAGAAAWAAPC